MVEVIVLDFLLDKVILRDGMILMAQKLAMEVANQCW
jgi:hypothetical protein